MKASFLQVETVVGAEDNSTPTIPDSITPPQPGESTLQTVTVRLRADQIYLDPVTDVRYGDPPSGQDGGLPELTSSMEWRQAEPLLVRSSAYINQYGVEQGYSRYSIINGRRRLAAMAHLPDYEFECRVVVGCDDDTAYRLALSTFRRRDLTVIQLLHNITKTRERMGWVGSNGAGKPNGRDNHWVPELAAYFGFSEAKIREIERLAVLPSDLQQDIHQGRLSPEAAYINAKVREKDPELADRVAAMAGEMAAKEQVGKTKAKKKRAGRKKTDGLGKFDVNYDVSVGRVGGDDRADHVVGDGSESAVENTGRQDPVVSSRNETGSGQGVSAEKGVNDGLLRSDNSGIAPGYQEDTDQDPGLPFEGSPIGSGTPSAVGEDRNTAGDDGEVLEIIGSGTGDTIGSVKITRKHMLRAGRSLAPEHLTRERDRDELLDFFMELTVTHYPRCMSRFAGWYAGEFASGLSGSDKHLQDLWDGIAQEIKRLERRLAEVTDGGDSGGGD